MIITGRSTILDKRHWLFSYSSQAIRKDSIVIAKSMEITGASLVPVSLISTAPTLASGFMGDGVNSGMKLGQSVYGRKIACKSCKFPGGLKGQDQVRSAINMIDNGQTALSAAEAKAAKHYINKRFTGN
jgi:hypothetical protein